MKAKKEKVVDRRIQKTKKALTEALIALILEKGYEHVTIQEIIDKANIGRSTFYIHYENKEQLLLDGPNNINVNLFMDESKDNEISFLSMYEHIAKNKFLAKAMLGKKSGHMMTGFIKNKISRKIKKNYSVQFSKGRNEQKMLTYLSDAAGAAVISILISWIEDDFSFSCEEISLKSACLITAIFENSHS